MLSEKSFAPPRLASERDPIVLSIITPSLNASALIKACITHVANESNSSIEHIVVDGGSEDGTQELLAQRQSAGGPPFQWISKPDRGQSEALNRGISLARGQFIGILNVDDRYEPGTLLRVLTLITQEAFETNAFLVGLCKWWNTDGSLRELSRHRDYSLARCLIGKFPPNPACYFYTRNIHALIGLYDMEEHYAMDLDFLIRAAPMCEKHFYNEVWGHFHMRDDCKTASAEARENSDRHKQRVIRKHMHTASLPTRVRMYCHNTRDSCLFRHLRLYFKHPRIFAGRVRQLLAGK